MQKKLQRGQEGQGLVEYALVLVLVAVVCIAIMFATGLSVQRVYGLIAGALGTKHNESNYKGQGVTIDLAQCYVIPAGDPNWQSAPFNQGFTGVYVHGYASNVAVSQLTLATDNTTINALADQTVNVENLGSGEFKFNPTLQIGRTDEGLCPRSVIVQSPNGAIATSPIEIIR